MRLSFLSLTLITLLSPQTANAQQCTGATGKQVTGGNRFNRISSFLVCSQIDSACNTDEETAAEIVSATADGMTLVYSNSPKNTIGFVDITTPAAPVGLGEVDVGGEPTSVTVKGDMALVAVNLSEDYVNVSGELLAVDIVTQKVLKSWALGGQPDSISLSPDGNYLCIAIENERDEDLGDGILPQMPAGYVVVVDSSSANLDEWSTTVVDLTGLDGVSDPTDPEPEFASINNNNECIVTLQENNALVLIDLPTATVIKSFSAGTVDLTEIDTVEDGVIDPTSSLTSIPREPDGVTWLDDCTVATADEGDMNGGSRGFTIFDAKTGNVLYTSGNEMEYLAIKAGHYPDERSENKGNEPENVAYGMFGNKELLFVNSERSSLVFVYDLYAGYDKPTYLQMLPAALAPEGSLAIPSRNLLVVASEDDAREDKMRSAINIYEWSKGNSYPTLVSEMFPLVPFSALSGLAPVPSDPQQLYSVEDSFYKKSRFFTIKLYDPVHKTPMIMSATRIIDSEGVLASSTTFVEGMINDDNTVNLDPEAIVAAPLGSVVYIASEGKGSAGDEEDPISRPNIILEVGANTGIIKGVIRLPQAVNDIQVKYGFEGLSYYDGNLVVGFQRAWGTEANPRLGIYNLMADTWNFIYYPLDEPESQNGGWVGIGDITAIGSGAFLVLERDNQFGPDAAIKRIYRIDLGSDMSTLTSMSTVEKQLVRDIIPDLKSAGGLVYEKMEGMALSGNLDVWIVNDNDGVDDNSGEIQLMNLGPILSKCTSAKNKKACNMLIGCEFKKTNKGTKKCKFAKKPCKKYKKKKQCNATSYCAWRTNAKGKKKCMNV